jgi:hypothetical protein
MTNRAAVAQSPRGFHAENAPNLEIKTHDRTKNAKSSTFQQPAKW